MLEFSQAIVAQLLLFIALLTPLELLWPARDEQRPLRRGLGVDLLHFAISPLLPAFGGAALLALIGVVLRALIPASLQALLSAQAFFVQVTEIIFVSELLTYFAHRAAHRVPLLWRFHAIHHSSESLDWMAAHRAHPLESLWLLGVANLAPLALGFSTESIIGFVLFQKIYTAFVHANVRIDVRGATWIIATPRFHRWHHDGDDRHGRNFAGLLPIFDRVFGTHALPDGEPRRLGSDEPVPLEYAGQLLFPFVQQARRAFDATCRSSAYSRW